MTDKLINIDNKNIENLVYFIRDNKVMLDADLAELYGVETKRLNEQVKRNIDRFPSDFMFKLTEIEWKFLQSQIATSNDNAILKSQTATSKRGGRRTLPFVFTEHGAVMLASVLNSPQAIEASVRVVRVFIKLREILATHKKLADKINVLESKYDKQFQEVFTILRAMLEEPSVQIQSLILRKGVKE